MNEERGMENVLYKAFRTGWLARKSLITSAPQDANELELEIRVEFKRWLRSAETSADVEVKG